MKNIVIRVFMVAALGISGSAQAWYGCDAQTGKESLEGAPFYLACVKDKKIQGIILGFPWDTWTSYCRLSTKQIDAAKTFCKDEFKGDLFENLKPIRADGANEINGGDYGFHWVGLDVLFPEAKDLKPTADRPDDTKKFVAVDYDNNIVYPKIDPNYTDTGTEPFGHSSDEKSIFYYKNMTHVNPQHK
jgi:hypothetical protein